jgi:hypothetical protein
MITPFPNPAIIQGVARFFETPVQVQNGMLEKKRGESIPSLMALLNSGRRSTLRGPPLPKHRSSIFINEIQWIRCYKIG